MNVRKGRKWSELMSNRAYEVMPGIRATICLVVFLFLVPFSHCVQAQENSFLLIAGIPGDSTDQSHKGWIECSSFSQEVSQLSDSTVCHPKLGTGTPGDFLVMKSFDQATPLLSLAAATGKHISQVTLEVTHGTTQQLIYRVVMTDVVVSKTSGGLPPNSGSGPTEEIAFRFRTIKWTFFRYNDRGELAGIIAAGWDVCAQMPVLATP